MATMSDLKTPKIAYGINEVAELTSLGRSTIYEEIRAKRLKAIKVRRRRIVTFEALTAWLQDRPLGSP
jgi:excisionase family DNA binding protein